MTPDVPEVLSIGQPRLTAGLDRLRRLDLTAYRAAFGPAPTLAPGRLIEMAEQVDLRGRGGAAFPVARKLRAVQASAQARRCPTAVLVNAAEGEPGSAKDKSLLLRSPHLVLEGAMLAARELHAKRVVVAVGGEGWHANSVQAAVREDPALARQVRVLVVPDRFVSGEGGALVNAVNGKAALPPGRKVRASERGIAGLPTLLSNAETFAQLAVLSMLGPEGYASTGIPDEPGTTLLTVGGSAARPAVVEAPTGTALGEILDVCEAAPAEGVLVGGYHGVWLPAELADQVPVSHSGLAAAGGTLGPGIVLPLGQETCPLGEVARVAAYLAKESSGQCGPCMLGLPAIARSVAAVPAGTRTARSASSCPRWTCSPTTCPRTCSAVAAGGRSAACCRSGGTTTRCGWRWTGPAAAAMACARTWCLSWFSSTGRVTRPSWTCLFRPGWCARPARRSRCAPRSPSGSPGRPLRTRKIPLWAVPPAMTSASARPRL